MIPQYLIDAKNSTDIKWLEIKSEAPQKIKEERSLVHFISTVDLDRQRDIMIPKGMVDKEFSLSPSVWYNHNYRFNDNALPVAKSLWRKKQEDGVLAKTQFATTAFAEDVYTLHEGEFMNTWSIGFRPVRDKSGVIEKDSIEYDESKNITTWHKWDLLEYSSAPIAANPHARDMIKDMKKINFKSEITQELILKMESDMENQSRMNDMQKQIDEMKIMCEEDMAKMSDMEKMMADMMTRTDKCEKEIMELMNKMETQKNLIEQKLIKNISIELPVDRFSNDRIKTIVKDAVNGSR